MAPIGCVVWTGDPPSGPVLGTLPPVSSESPGPEDTGPDDPDHSAADGDGLRGWIDPDDRLWRHPSESGAPGPAAPTGRARHRSNPWLLGGLAASAVAVLLVTGLIVANSGASPGALGGATSTSSVTLPPPTTEPGTAHLASATDMARAVASVRPDLVVLDVTRHGSSATATGLSAEAGGIIVTTVDAVTGATGIVVDEADGDHETAQMVGQDPTSGIAVLRGTADLPVANFDLGDPAPGSTALAVAATSGTSPSSAPSATVYAGTVASSGWAVDADAVTTDFASTAVRAPLDARDQGCALLDAQGQVSGILDTTTTSGTTTMAVFLPAELVVGVAHQLVAGGSIERGWLGVDASDASSSPSAVVTGALLDTVDQGGAAARAGLRVGDTIVAVGGVAVHSVAELRTRLYSDLPGSIVSVTFDRAGVQTTTSVELDPSGADASGSGSSP